VYSVFQTKFAGAPLQLEDAIGRIRQLNTPSVTREKVHSIAQLFFHYCDYYSQHPTSKGSIIILQSKDCLLGK